MPEGDCQITIQRLFNNPSPFIPLPFIRGEGTEFLKGAPPPFNPLHKQARLEWLAF